MTGLGKALGPEQTSTVHKVNNLGLLYADQGKLDEAEKMYMQAVAGLEKALGWEHTSTLRTVNNLGLLFADQGKLSEAEHPDTLRSDIQTPYLADLASERQILGSSLLKKILASAIVFLLLFGIMATHILSFPIRPQIHPDYYKVCIPKPDFWKPRQSTRSESRRGRESSK